MEGTPYQLSLFAAGVGCVGYCLSRLREWYRIRSFGLKDIPGSDSESHSLGPFPYVLLTWSIKYSPASFYFFSAGNIRQPYQSEVGETDFRWQKQFGGIMRLKGPSGVRLWSYLTGTLARI